MATRLRFLIQYSHKTVFGKIYTFQLRNGEFTMKLVTRQVHIDKSKAQICKALLIKWQRPKTQTISSWPYRREEDNETLRAKKLIINLRGCYFTRCRQDCHLRQVKPGYRRFLYLTRIIKVEGATFAQQTRSGWPRAQFLQMPLIDHGVPCPRAEDKRENTSAARIVCRNYLSAQILPPTKKMYDSISHPSYRNLIFNHVHFSLHHSNLFIITIILSQVSQLFHLKDDRSLLQK